MFVDETTEETEYKDGYEVGYAHLSYGRWNFLHPYGQYIYPSGRILHGYIPGGPTYFTRVNTWQKGYEEQNHISYKLNQAWIKGWIDGINKYTKENNLPYAQVPNER